jgi:hypothetical protein
VTSVSSNTKKTIARVPSIKPNYAKISKREACVGIKINALMLMGIKS